MNGWHVLLIVVAIIFLMIIVLRFLLPYLKRRGVNVEAILGQTKDMISAVDKTLDTIRPFLPASPGQILYRAKTR